jgi:hypothetical protein
MQPFYQTSYQARSRREGRGWDARQDKTADPTVIPWTTLEEDYILTWGQC